MLKRTLALSAGLLTLVVAADANAFWYARGWRGGVAVGGFRPPAVVAPYYLNGCLRCAPYYHPGLAAALAARAGVAAGVAAGAAAGAAAAGAAAAPPPAPAPAPAAPSSSSAAGTPADQGSDDNTASSSGNAGGQQTAAAPSASASASSSSSAASSGKGKASACAAGLSKDAKAIYDATAPQVGSLATLRETVVEQTRSLVMAGKIGQGTAKSSAQAAGECLAMLAHN
jgi:hypothetical protein